MKTHALLALAGAALLASACGYRGDLQRPPPIWGDAERSPAPDVETAPSEEDEQRAPLP
jgi:hypothetical protein